MFCVERQGFVSRESVLRMIVLTSMYAGSTSQASADVLVDVKEITVFNTTKIEN